MENDLMSSPEWEEIKQYVIDDILKKYPDLDPEKIHFVPEGESVGLFYDGERKGELHYKVVPKEKAPIFNNINPN